MIPSKPTGELTRGDIAGLTSPAELAWALGRLVVPRGEEEIEATLQRLMKGQVLMVFPEVGDLVFTTRKQLQNFDMHDPVLKELFDRIRCLPPVALITCWELLTKHAEGQSCFINQRLATAVLQAFGIKGFNVNTGEVGR